MIKEIKWNNHEVLGNLTLDFTKPDGSVYNTIVLAGENGSGKTTVLNTLAHFLNLGSFEPFDYIKYEINNNPYRLERLEQEERSALGFHTRINESNGNTKRILSNRNNSIESIKSDMEDIRHYGVAYSKARSGFPTKKVKTSSTEQLDINSYDIDEKDDFTSIKQLLIDIDNRDNRLWAEQSKKDSHVEYKQFMSQSHLSRFRNAFDNFFDALSYEKIDDSDPAEWNVIFRKNDNMISVDSLSTGEKQIVFRGSYLLRNMKSLSGGVVMIDEPELSMHPKWQEKILTFYRNLFCEDGKQTVQMILATHSEYVLKAALEDKENILLIVLNEEQGVIKSKCITTPSALPVITSAETNYLAFGILSVDYHIELYGYLQSKTGSGTIMDCDRYILSQTGLYNPAIHEKCDNTSVNGHVPGYQTLPTYIRNAIDHPDSGRTYTQEELRTSIELLIELCK